MKKILYISNIEVPYRVTFFNELSKLCDLTVLYERKLSSNRNKDWSISVRPGGYNVIYLSGFNYRNENSLSLKILKIIRQDWDHIIIGCYNSITQMLAISYMRLCGIKYMINLDGEQFINNDFKGKIKKLVLKGALAYLTAGEKSGNNLRAMVGKNAVIRPYYFSSLFRQEIINNGKYKYRRNKIVLVVGQYYDYKGMDVAFKVASMDESIQYKFVGMGNRTELFGLEQGERPNIQIIPFLQKEALINEYKECAMLLLPSRQECWGLVINEAASFGMPIVSTWGSGAAVEFLADKYPQYLAIPGDEYSLYECVKKCLNSDTDEYIDYLCKKSFGYSIEESVLSHLNAFENL